MRDLLSSLTTNLHILVIAILLTGLGLGMISGTAPGHSTTKQNPDQPVITLSTTPSIPSKQPQSGPHRSIPTPSNGPVSRGEPATTLSGPSVHQNTTPPSSDVPAAPVLSTPPSQQPLCATCDSTADCPDSCLSQASLPWRPEPPTITCCGGRKVTIAYQPSFVMCPMACTPNAAQ